ALGIPVDGWIAQERALQTHAATPAARARRPGGDTGRDAGRVTARGRRVIRGPGRRRAHVRAGDGVVAGRVFLGREPVLRVVVAELLGVLGDTDDPVAPGRDGGVDGQ